MAGLLSREALGQGLLGGPPYRFRQPYFATSIGAGMNAPPYPPMETPGVLSKMIVQPLQSLAGHVQQADDALWGRYPMEQADIEALGGELAGVASPGALLGAPVKSGLGMGIRAYHGSPHDFDRFSMDKIGTGEGAQAYGHGLYMAENEAVARGYRDALSPRYSVAKEPDGTFTVEEFSGRTKPIRGLTEEEARKIADQPAGRMYEVDIDASPDEFLDWDKPLSEQSPKVQEVFRGLGYDVGATKYKTPQKWHDAAYKYLSGKEAARLVNTDLGAAADILAARKAWNRGPEALQEYMNSADGTWLRGQLGGGKFGRDGDKLGGVAYRELSDKLGGFGQMQSQGGGQVRASEALRTAGASDPGKPVGERIRPTGGASADEVLANPIPGVKGIRYKDAGSRSPDPLLDGKPIPSGDWAAMLAAEKLQLYGSPEAALKSFNRNGPAYARETEKAAAELIRSGRVAVPTEGGTHNYVVFDDNIIEILKKYGIVGLTAGGAGAALLGGSDPASAAQPTYRTGGRF